MLERTKNTQRTPVVHEGNGTKPRQLPLLMIKTRGETSFWGEQALLGRRT